MYYVVHDWMISELHLKGLEKELYAIIYGFSQDGDSEFLGAIQYISSLTAASDKGIRKAIGSLLDKNLIQRDRKDNFSPFRYSVVQSSIPCGTKYRLGVVQSTDNRNIYRNKEIEDTNVSSKKKVFNHDEDAYQAAACLARYIAERIPTCKPKGEADLQRWASDFDKCHRIDGHDWDEIESVLIFSQEDAFWKNNILSGEKFRRQYEQLLLKSEERNEKRT